MGNAYSSSIMCIYISLKWYLLLIVSILEMVTSTTKKKKKSKQHSESSCTSSLATTFPVTFIWHIGYKAESSDNSLSEACNSIDTCWVTHTQMYEEEYPFIIASPDGMVLFNSNEICSFLIYDKRTEFFNIYPIYCNFALTS